MKDLMVKKAGDFSYEITFQKDFNHISEYLKKLNLNGQKVCIVTDTNVAPLYLEELKAQICDVFSVITDFIFLAGEENKKLDVIRDIYEHLINNHFERKDILLALGGGVVGDMTGFAAATYLRGIEFVQVPTTLLAQVDSSVGGKTGVDFDSYKNMVGAFHQPSLVYMNMKTLNTLPDVEFSCGMGEVLKSALIRDDSFYEWTINHMSEIMDREEDVLTSMVSRCCLIKKTVVENDPTEQGERAILNFGHTIGHAIEKYMNFELLHGQCVALGTCAAAYISNLRGYLTDEELYEIRDMNVGFDLPIAVDFNDASAILDITKSDKKMENGKVKFVLLKSMGHAIIVHDVTDEEILEGINFVKGVMNE